jgi:hypothetical protein
VITVLSLGFAGQVFASPQVDFVQDPQVDFVQVEKFKSISEEDKTVEELVDSFASVYTHLPNIAKAKKLPAKFIEGTDSNISRQINKKLNGNRLSYDALDRFAALKSNKGIRYIIVTSGRILQATQGKSVQVKSTIVRIDDASLVRVQDVTHDYRANISLKVFWKGWASKIVNALLRHQGLSIPEEDHVLVLGSTFHPDFINIGCEWSKSVASNMSAFIDLALRRVLLQGQLKKFAIEMHSNSREPLKLSTIEVLKDDDEDAAFFVYAEITVLNPNRESCEQKKNPENETEIVLVLFIEDKNDFKKSDSEEARVQHLQDAIEVILNRLRSEIASEDVRKATFIN